MSHKYSNARERGLAMITVLLVLMALFVLSAPFLVTVRNADQASAEGADRAVLRISLDAGERHAAAELEASHPALDPTPYFDDTQELTVTSAFPKDFLATDDPRQVMWGLEAEDVAGKIDLASASPHVLANLIGGATRLSTAAKEKDTAIEVNATEGFLPEGVVLVDDEWMGYAELTPSELKRLTRGLMVKTDAGGNPAECGPTPAKPHDIGAFVLDQRAFALCEWRTAPNKPKGELRVYESLEEVREAKDFMLGPELGRAAFLTLERTASAFGHVRAGVVWQRASRVVGDPTGEPQYGCKLAVDDLRWFNPGTTVWITDGAKSEYALVRRTEEGKLVLFEPLQSEFKAYRTVVAPLARRPVNVNTASPEVLKALWTNLKLAGRTARITAGEADQLVDLALVSRPFTGFEDFLRRLVLPAAGLDELPEDAPVRPEALTELARQSKIDATGNKVLTGFIDADDARALYKNALNANDNELEFATMPLCFTSRDVYELELRAAVNAPSGTARAQGRRELVELIVPQRDLLSVWTRQEDFDEAPRLGLDAAGWLTGPVPTSRYDARYGDVTSSRWPTRAIAHLGVHDTSVTQDKLAALDQGATLTYAFADRENEDGWAQLAPFREDDRRRKASYALHFDDESKELEGRFLPDAPASLDLAKLGWSGASNLMSGMAASFWVQPRKLEDGAKLLDVSGRFSDTDRLSLLFENGNLVLRVLDGAGDHPRSEFKERAEVRFPLSGEGPGMPADTWTHVQVAVDGTRPDQMALWVDGRRAEHTPGLTRLTAALSEQSDSILVEATEGFPDKCVLRIGDELIEALKIGEKSFRARFQATGELAGFGGRIAREYFSGYPELNGGVIKSIGHPAGSTVQLYGYSLPVFSNVPNGATNLRQDLGMFAVARVEGITIRGSEKTQTSMEAITPQGFTFSVGNGFDSRGDDLDGLILEPVDPKRSIEDTMKAFSPTGGYAAVIAPLYDGSPGHLKDVNGARINGIEVIQYTGYQGKTLKLSRREGAGLKKLTGQVREEVAGRGSFIVFYTPPPDPGIPDPNDPPLADRNGMLSYKVMVIPISIPAQGASGAGFDPGNNGSAFVQLTHSGGESHLTEWVRYDEIGPDGSFVRDDPEALVTAYNAMNFGAGRLQPPQGQNSIVLASTASTPLVVWPNASRPFARPQDSQGGRGGGSFWDYTIGVPDDEGFPVARAVNSRFQFRGVLGTFQHEHTRGTLILPVFHTRQAGETSGYPGRFDHVMFLSPEVSEPGFDAVVQHAHRPLEYLAYNFTSSGLEAKAVEAVANLGQTGFRTTLIHVALDDRLAVPFIPSSIVDDDANPIDSRLLSRMALFPSGELPREVLKGQFGGDSFSKGQRGTVGVPSVVVDEALFFPSELGNLSGMPVQLVLATGIDERTHTFQTEKDTLRAVLGEFVFDPDDEKKEQGKAPKKRKRKTESITDVLAKLPKHGGLLRMGDELLCYDGYTTTNNVTTFSIPDNGRGLLGTTPQPHRPSEAISFIGAIPVGVLAGKLRPDDAEIHLLEQPERFPAQGLVRLDDELVHYSRLDGQTLRMPRASAEPGEMDEKGPGLFRGRFGTVRAEHESGTPVVLFPFRYWDRWKELADAPELTYFELACDQPDAYWQKVFWKATVPAHPGPELAVLERTNPDTPWDAAPSDTNGLRVLTSGKLDGDGNSMGVQSDRAEWRVFVRYRPGAFDPLTGLAHGWKTTPRLELFGVQYMGPNRTLARVDR